MAVYIDASGHLTADTLAELHRFAMELGLVRISYQHNHQQKEKCSYPLPEGKREQAIQQGAHVIDSRDCMHVCE